MDINDVRLANIERLAKTYKYGKDFCEAAGIDPSYLSQLRARVKQTGTQLARRIEQRLGLQHGALDERLPGTTATQPGHAAISIAHAIESLSPEVRRSIAALVFELAKQQMQAHLEASDAELPAPHQGHVPVSTFDVTVPDESQSSSVPRRSRKR